MLGLSAVTAACGGSVTPKIAGGGATPTSAATSASPALKAASTPKAATAITIAPQMYGAGNPCAGVTASVPAASVDNDCFRAWFTYINSIPSDVPVNIPGQDTLDKSPMPKTALVAQGVDAATGKQYADAFFRFETLSLFAEREQAVNMLSTLDGPAWTGRDIVLQKMIKGYRVYDAQDCTLPTQVSVVTLDTDSFTYMEAHGFQPHSKTAIVATFPACQGIYMNTQGQLAGWFDGLSAPASVVVTGTVATASDVLGEDFYIDGEATCGPSQMAGVCGS